MLYYYADNDQQFGPFTVEELKSKRLKKSTLVWTEGMLDWTSANDIEELKDILVSEPPPLPKRATKSLTIETIQTKQPSAPVYSSKYDLTYEKEVEATYYGILLFVIPFLLKLGGILTFETEKGYNLAKVFFVISSLVLRIAVTVYVVKIASRQNRNSTGWGWFSFFLPSIALIIIGQLKKIRLKIELDGSLTTKQQMSILLEKAKQLFDENRHSECIEVLNKVIEFDKKNFHCFKLRGIANYNIKNYQEAKADFELLIKNEVFQSVANFYLGNLSILDNDRELAISFWLKAHEQNYEGAIIKLDQFHTFKGNYLLNYSQVVRKISTNSSVVFIDFRDGKYQGGLPHIDKIERSGSLKTQINGYDLGLDIELKKAFKTYHLAISYYEIDNIVIKKSDKLFELHLNDKNILTFSYDMNIDYNRGLWKVCKMFKKKTGKTPDAASAWND